MNIVIDIANLVNRGDWLMFEAIHEKVLKRFPFAHVSVPRRAFLRDKDYFREKGVIMQLDKISLKIIIQLFLSALRHKDLFFLKYMKACSVDMLLYSPGFKFSDQFQAEDYEIDADINHFKSFTKRGRKVVFLPQAFGPFKTPAAKYHVTECCREANHIYARERTSYNYLIEVIGESNRVSIVPDFTCLYHGKKYSLPFSKESGYVVIIPNRQMLVKSQYPSEYCDFMIKLVRFLHERGENVVLLNHEDQADIGLIEVLNATISNEGVIISGVSGGACKSIISGAKLVVTSRFHGLVSALAEGVPVLCTSWSHKYQELVTEMGCYSSCLDMNNIKSSLEIVVDSMNHPEHYTASYDSRQKWKTDVERMWDEVLK